MNLKDRITAFAVADIFGKAVTETIKTGRATLTGDMQAEGAQTMRALLPDGTVLGTMSYRKGTSAAHVTDRAAFDAYVAETYPHNVIPERVETIPAHTDPTFEAALLKSLAAPSGEAVDTATGVCVPGVEYVTGEPSVAFKAEPDARQNVLRAVATGALDPMRALTDGGAS